MTIHLPGPLAAGVEQRARRAGKSVSAWIAEVLERELGSRPWPSSVVDVLSRGRGDLVEPDDPPLATELW